MSFSKPGSEGQLWASLILVTEGSSSPEEIVGHTEQPGEEKAEHNFTKQVLTVFRLSHMGFLRSALASSSSLLTGILTRRVGTRQILTAPTVIILYMRHMYLVITQIWE